MFSYQVSLPDFELRLNIIYCYAYPTSKACEDSHGTIWHFHLFSDY